MRAVTLPSPKGIIGAVGPVGSSFSGLVLQFRILRKVRAAPSPIIIYPSGEGLRPGGVPSQGALYFAHHPDLSFECKGLYARAFMIMPKRRWLNIFRRP